VQCVTVTSCCIYCVCLLDGFVQHNYIRYFVMDISISYYGPVVV
jgi:hypothetical protein